MHPEAPKSPSHPSNFHGAPSHALSAHPTAAPVRVVEVPSFIPPPAPMPTASISPKGVLSLHASLMRAFGLRYGQAINLHPPVFNSIYWHLDLRPEAPCIITQYDNQRPQARGIALPEGLLSAPLTLSLLPGEPTYKGVYPMIECLESINRFASKNLSFEDLRAEYESGLSISALSQKHNVHRKSIQELFQKNGYNATR